MRIEQIRQRLRANGALPCHEHRVLRAWIQNCSLDNRHSKAEGFLPKAVLADVPSMFADLEQLATLRLQQAADDGAVRLLVGLKDGQSVESVLLPRDGLCVSTQVGCAVGCTFCMTGKDGLLRQLGSAEIVAQVALARRLRKVHKVVFMGMGEPAHNLDNVLEAIDFLGKEGGIAHKNLVFSTVGDERVFQRLPLGAVKPALALSLHSTRAELRAQLLPKAPRLEPEHLVEMGEIYARRTGYPIQYQWTLLAGINDGDDELEGMVRLLKGKYAMMNLIPYNDVDALPYRRPYGQRTAEMVRKLHQHGILAKVRHSAGQEIDGGCGQLRARHRTDQGAHRAVQIVKNVQTIR